MSTNSEWTILEKLLLTQAVYKYGENMWFQVARVLKQHGLIQAQQRQSDFFSQKNCQFQYYLLVENLEAEKQVYRSNDLKNDMPPVVRIARQLYTQRVEEVKSNLKKNEEEFGKLAQEIESIKAGKWDQELKKQLPVTNNNTQLDSITQSSDSVDDSIAQSTEANVNPTQVSVIPEVQATTLPQHVTNEENRMKRTSSETAIITGSSMKRCRLDEGKVEKQEETSNEDQVLSTAIAVVSDDGDSKAKQQSNFDISETTKPEITKEKNDDDSNVVVSNSQTDEKQEPNTTSTKVEDEVMSDINHEKNDEVITENTEVSVIEQNKDVEYNGQSNESSVASNPILLADNSNLENMNNLKSNLVKDDAMETDRGVDITNLEHGAILKEENKIEEHASIPDNQQQDTTQDDVTVLVPQPSDNESQLPHYNSHNHDIPLSSHELPKISIPEPSHFISLNPHHRLEQSASPSSKLNIMTPDEEDFTSSETATPTSTSTFDKKRSSTNNDQRQKAWQKNINLLWQEIANHKNGTMFMNPIKKSYAPLYDKVVKQPIYLKTIKNRVRDGIVKTTAEFERDVVLMLTNSLMYNKEGTEMYLMALEMLDDVREQIRLFKSADGYSVSAWENAGESSSAQP